MEKQWKQWQILFWGAPKSLQMVIAAMELKNICSLKKSYDQSRWQIKSRDITLPTKVPLVKDMVFPVVIYRCESWTIRKAEHQRIAACELWCWRRLLRVPWTARKSNQSILKEISPEYSLKGNGTSLQYSCLENPMYRGTWWAAVRGVAKSWTQSKRLSTHIH